MVQLTTTSTKSSTDEALSNTTVSELERLALCEKSIRDSGKWDAVIPNPKSRKTPRLCLFVTSLVFVMVAAVVLVLVIKLSLSRREDSCCETSPTPTDEDVEQVNFDKQGNWNLDISWELKRAFLELRQTLGDFEPKVLFPVYRKDLSSHYVAYYELKLEQPQGKSYAVISAGEETGDYSLVETGDLPSPLDRLRDQAFLNGHHCAKFFRLTTDGITICEDHRIKRIVAATGDIVSELPVTDWKQLDEQVSKALPRLEKEWRKLAKEAIKMKEWKAFGKSTIFDPPNNDQEGSLTEKGLHPGEFAEIPVQNDVTEVTIKFVGLGKEQTGTRSVNISLRKWQTKLCKVLDNICDSHSPTTVRHDVTTLNFAGSKYLKFRVNADENYVRTELENEEIRFVVELKVEPGELITMRYGIVLREKRLGRSVERFDYEIPDEKSFPNLQHRNECRRAGTMISAWAMIFSYYDGLAKSRPELGYRKLGFNKNKLGKRFSTIKERERYTAKFLTSKVDMKCPSLKQQVQHWNKRKLERWFQQQQGATARIVYIGGAKRRPKATRKAIHLLKKGIPVVISKEPEFTTSPHYGVATRMRQRNSSYRHCVTAQCSMWKEMAITEFFVRDGSLAGKWQNACTHYVAAALKE